MSTPPSNPYAYANELEQLVRTAYEAVEAAIARDADETEIGQLEAKFLSAEQIWRVEVHRVGALLQKQAQRTVAQGQHDWRFVADVSNHVYPQDVGKLFKCSKCATRCLQWPGRVVPLGQYPRNCPT